MGDGRDPEVDPEAIKRALSRATRYGAHFADCYIQRVRVLSLTLQDNRVAEVSSSVQQGASFRIERDGVSGFQSTTDISEEGLLRAADQAADMVRGNRPNLLRTLRYRGWQIGEEKLWRLRGTGAIQSDLRNLQAIEVVPRDSAVQAKLDMLHAMDVAARGERPSVKGVTAAYGESESSIIIANTDGTFVRDRRTSVTAGAQVVAIKGAARQQGLRMLARAGGMEVFATGSHLEAAVEAARLADQLLDAMPSPSGEKVVVLGNGFGGVILHEGVGHNVEAEQDTRRQYMKLNFQVGSSIVNAVDDATVPGLMGSFGVDDEGTPAQRTTIIKDGRIAGYLTDRHSSTNLGLPLLTARSTGNGRRHSFAWVPQTRMSNTFILPGDSTVEDLIRSTPRGVYAKRLGGGQVNPVTKEFLFGVLEAYLIEDGRVTRPLVGCTVSGNADTVLNEVDMVANDLEHERGRCGKGEQWVPVTVGQPHVRLRKLTVGGPTL
jgi:TldD protein